MSFLFASTTSDGKPLTFALVRGMVWNDDFILVDQATGLPIDLTGIAGLMMRIRAAINAPGHLLELSLANNGLVIVDAAAGRVGIRVNSAATLAAFPANDHRKAKYVYDAVIERTAGEYEPAIRGKVRVDPQITRPFESA